MTLQPAARPTKPPNSFSVIAFALPVRGSGWVNLATVGSWASLLGIAWMNSEAGGAVGVASGNPSWRFVV
jgi:hypothetical protein